MRDVTSHNFGLLIAYVLPGVTALWGASYFSPTVRVWLGAAPADSPTVGGFLYLTIAAVAAGLIASTVRWAVIDTLHHLTGVPRPSWDFSRLQKNIAAFELIVEHQYRYYQSYSNMLVSLVFLFVARRSSLGHALLSWDALDAGLLVLVFIFFLGSRDTLKKYVHRGDMLFSEGGKCQCCGERFSKQPSPPPSDDETHPRVLNSRSTRRKILGTRLKLYLANRIAGEKTDAGGQTPAHKT